mgnify:CR=1 FL=1
MSDDEEQPEEEQPKYDGPDWFGDPSKGGAVSPELLMARYHAMMHDAGNAVAGRESVKMQSEKRPISHHLRPHPKATYTDEEKAKAKELDRAFGRLYMRDETWNYDEIMAAAKELEHITVQRGYAKHSDPEDFDRAYNANTRDVDFKPYASLVKSMEYQEASWRKLLASREPGKDKGPAG